MRKVIKGTLSGCVVLIVLSIIVPLQHHLGAAKSDCRVVHVDTPERVGYDRHQTDSVRKDVLERRDADRPRHFNVETNILVEHMLIVSALAVRLHAESDLNMVEDLAQRLAAIGSSNAVAVMLYEIRHTDDSVKRGLIARAFQRLDNSDAIGAVMDGLWGISDDYVTLSALRECAPRVLNTNGLALLLTALEQPISNSWQKANMMGYLSEVRSPECVGLLADTVRSTTNDLVREQTIVSLAEIGDSASFSNLLEFVADQSLSNSYDHILYMIGNMKNKDSLSSIATVFLSSTNESLKYAAARALVAIRAVARPENGAEGYAGDVASQPGDQIIVPLLPPP
jgi:hypothetical protein